jgi:polyphenol oxidase
MTLITKKEIKYFSFKNFASFPITQAIFSRHGGVSPSPWKGLNMGTSVGDERSNVIKNRERVFSLMNRPIASLSDSWLVHDKAVLEWKEPRPSDIDGSPKADIILTNNPKVSLFMRYADCVPIMLYDPENKGLALIHAGWKGTVKKVGRVAVEAMVERYGSNPSKIVAGIGPSISVDNYEVGDKVIEQVKKSFPIKASQLLSKYGARVHFDLWEANKFALQEAGVVNIEIAGLCTFSKNEDWFSHRKEKGKTGRFGAILGLNG